MARSFCHRLSDLGIFISNLAVGRQRHLRSRGATAVAVLCAFLAATSCSRSPDSETKPERHYEARGIIRGFAPDRRSIDVEHEDIRGFMPSMTMPFAVRDPKELAQLNLNDAISFRLSVTDNDSWIDRVKKIALDEVALPARKPAAVQPTTNSARLHEGDKMPPLQLTDQDGKAVTLETFRGHPFVLTFIFTRCPIPNFCPLMSRNFSDLQNAIQTGSGRLAYTKLLSISFDPAFDTPQVLKSYAEHEQADPKLWSFATGEKSDIEKLTHAFSVYVQAEGGTISHGLATAFVDGDGKILRIWRGNGWKPVEVIDAINAQNQ